MAGSGNYKLAYRASFPTVAIEQAQLGRIITRDELETMGIMAPARPPASPLRCSTDRQRLPYWPDWNRCLDDMLARGKKRSAADFYFACIARDRYGHTPEEIADKLMEFSSKARENGYDYALGQAERAAERVAENPYKGRGR